jgi:hypothetical protein
LTQARELLFEGLAPRWTVHSLVCGGACWARRFSYDT